MPGCYSSTCIVTLKEPENLCPIGYNAPDKELADKCGVFNLEDMCFTTDDCATAATPRKYLCEYDFKGNLKE